MTRTATIRGGMVTRVRARRANDANDDANDDVSRERAAHGTRGSGAGVFDRERGNVGRRAAAMGSRGNGGTTRARSGGDGSEGEGRGKGKGKGGGGGRKGRGTVITSSPEEREGA